MTKNNEIIKPILKYVGGKSKVLPDIKANMPSEYNRYFEPFLGGASVLLGIQPKSAIVNDINFEGSNLYRVVKNNPCELIEDLKKHVNEKEYYYSIRALDRDEELFAKLTAVERASRILYINKTGFNGILRYSQKGYLNVPMGKYKNPNIVNEEGILKLSKYLNENDITILNTDFIEACADAKEGDFIYSDSPYIPISKTSSFTSYNADGFTIEDQIRLRDLALDLDKRGCKVMLSNSSADMVYDLYRGFNIRHVEVARAINSKWDGRGKIKEVLITNY